MYVCRQVWMYIYTKWVAFIYYLCSKSWKFSRLQNNSNYNNYSNAINNSDAYLEIVKLNDSATVSAAATTTRSRSSTTIIPTPTNRLKTSSHQSLSASTAAAETEAENRTYTRCRITANPPIGQQTKIVEIFEHVVFLIAYRTNISYFF